LHDLLVARLWSTLWSSQFGRLRDWRHA